MSGTIILIDGVAGCGKTTVLAGMPGPRAILDTDDDGVRWLKQEFSEYSKDRAADAAKRILSQWADMPNQRVTSIAIDTWAYFWQMAAQQVLEGEMKTRFRNWGSAKMSIRRLYDPLKRAKQAGKHICLTAHTKDSFKVEEGGGKTEISKEGQKPDCEAMVNDLLDVHLRMEWNIKADTRWFTTIKCRPQKNWKPLLPRKIDIPREQSHLMYPQILAMIGEAPASAVSSDSEAEDIAAQAAMQAAQAAGGR